jgi:hypothetical protein
MVSMVAIALFQKIQGELFGSSQLRQIAISFWEKVRILNPMQAQMGFSGVDGNNGLGT